MSIIERAAGRLKTNSNEKSAAPAPLINDEMSVPSVPAQAYAAPSAPPDGTDPNLSASEKGAQILAKSALQEAIQTSSPATPAATPAATPVATPAIPEAVATNPQEQPAPTAKVVRNAPAKKIEINLERLTEMGFLTPGGRSLISEQFRMIKRPLLKQAFAPREATEHPGNLIMVTSSLPNEGKTFCSINLALSIAMELDHTVLLVDVDVARPSILRTLDVGADAENEAGLMDLLLDSKIDMSDVLLKTNVDTLSILPVGRNHTHSSELLASQAMQVLLEEIASRYPDRIVIFDSPPLLVTSEANVLASKMGQIVMVVGGEETSQQAVKTSLSQLSGCKNVSLIYNKSMAFTGSGSYGYGYGYGTY